MDADADAGRDKGHAVNPITMWKVYRKANTLVNLLQEAALLKSLWTSKTFWFNVLSVAAELTQILPLPPGTVLIVTNLINIGLRVVTGAPVHIVAPK